MDNDLWTDPSDWLDREAAVLAPFAIRTADSRGRRHAEPPHPFRTLYQRDRDRIVHATAFRRLMGKTQVLIAQSNDHHRTRLTHTLEVAMLSRTIARRLCLNEDLTEAIALSHDLGHPPFGHAGEQALDACMKDQGGFEHNLQGLRIVEHLEYRYPDFPGLNLSWEVLEAMAFHSKRRETAEVQPYLLSGQPFLEAQVVDAADNLAYNTHDVDDALAFGLIAIEDLEAIEFWNRAVEQVRRKHGDLGPEQFRPTVIRQLLDWQVADLLEHTIERLRQHRIGSVADVRGAAELLVAGGPEVTGWKRELEQFLHQHVYRHYRVMRMATKGSRLLTTLFDEFCRAPELLPARYARRAVSEGRERTACDYLAGMTDRFAQEEHQRLFQPFTRV